MCVCAHISGNAHQHALKGFDFLLRLFLNSFLPLPLSIGIMGVLVPLGQHAPCMYVFILTQGLTVVICDLELVI